MFSQAASRVDQRQVLQPRLLRSPTGSPTTKRAMYTDGKLLNDEEEADDRQMLKKRQKDMDTDYQRQEEIKCNTPGDGDYKLVMVQEPTVCRAHGPEPRTKMIAEANAEIALEAKTGQKPKNNRKPVTWGLEPQPVVAVVDNDGASNSYLNLNANLFMRANLRPAMSNLDQNLDDKALIGERIASVYKIYEPAKWDVGWAHFPQLFVKEPGKYFLEFILMERVEDPETGYPHLVTRCSTLSRVFEALKKTAKLPPVTPVTNINGMLDGAGIKSKYRRPIRAKKTKASNWDTTIADEKAVKATRATRASPRRVNSGSKRRRLSHEITNQVMDPQLNSPWQQDQVARYGMHHNLPMRPNSFNLPMRSSSSQHAQGMFSMSMHGVDPYPTSSAQTMMSMQPQGPHQRGFVAPPSNEYGFGGAPDFGYTPAAATFAFEPQLPSGVAAGPQSALQPNISLGGFTDSSAGSNIDVVALAQQAAARAAIPRDWNNQSSYSQFEQTHSSYGQAGYTQADYAQVDYNSTEQDQPEDSQSAYLQLEQSRSDYPPDQYPQSGYGSGSAYQSYPPPQ